MAILPDALVKTLEEKLREQANQITRSGRLPQTAISAEEGRFAGNAIKASSISNESVRNLFGIKNANTKPANSFEEVHAILTPFRFPNMSNPHALAEIQATGGVVFPYSPSISEDISVKYDSVELTHSNESFYGYKGTDNVRITISDATWTCDTFDNAFYALAVLHFFRAYSFMDMGRFRSGRPPSPMWFSAFGNYAYNRVPCLFEKAPINWPSDIDYVGIPEVGTQEYENRYLERRRSASPNGKYTWLPVKFTIPSISLIVQHTPAYWTNFNLEDFFSGEMLRREGSFHINEPASNPEIVALPEE